MSQKTHGVLADQSIWVKGIGYTWIGATHYCALSADVGVMSVITDVGFLGVFDSPRDAIACDDSRIL